MADLSTRVRQHQGTYMLSLEPACGLNRKQPRALSALRYGRTINGISHERLTGDAFALLKGLLTDYGNALAPEHETALYALLGTFTEYAQGRRKGRLAFGMATGMAKTTAVIAWCTALVKLGLDHVSVAIAAHKVEALCAIKRELDLHASPFR
jgi:hypothetical protein